MHQHTKILLLKLLLFSFLNCLSQAETTGVILKELEAHREKDTLRVDLLNALANQFCNDNPEKAFPLLEKSEELSDKLHYTRGKTYCYLLFSKAYGTKRAYEKAIEYASQGSAMANRYGYSAYKREFFMVLSALSYDKNETKADTAVAEEVRDMVAAIKYKYFLKDSLDKSIENAGYLQKEVEVKSNELIVSKLEKYLWMLGCIALIILFGFVFTQFKVRKVKLENRQLLTEQKLFRSQMNPHFIFNSIQNIRSLISNKKDVEAIDYLNRFSQLTRRILETSNENYIPLTEELEFIHDYTVLQQLLYRKAFKYTVSVDDGIDADSVFIPPLLTQPFIENAIKHGLGEQSSEGVIAIRFYLSAKKLLFEIIDNGNGFLKDNGKKGHKSLAMNITRERLSRYHKQSNIAFRTENIINGKIISGARVIFEIPYIYET